MNNILFVTKNQTVNTKLPIIPTEINIFLAITVNHINKTFPILYSLLKYSQSKFNVYIMLDQQNIQSYYYQFMIFQNQRMKITLLDCTLLNLVLNKKHNMKSTNMAYARMLIPTILPNIDRILYLDYDTILVNKGIEWLYNINFEEKCISTFCREKNTEGENHPQRILFSNIKSTYFNSGVLLWNLKKIRECNKDKQMIQMLQNEPITSQNNQELSQIKKKLSMEKQTLLQLKLYDQSMLNWLFRDEDVLPFNPIFNSHFINRKNITKDYITNWKFINQQEFIDNIIVAHYSTWPKPWENVALQKLDKHQKYLHQQYKNLINQMIEKILKKIISL